MMSGVAGRPKLTIVGLTVAAGGRTLVSRVDVEIAGGELLGLSGPSGLGKTTLLRCLAGLVDPVSGQVLLDGQGGDEMGWPRFRRRVVYVAQIPVLREGSVRDSLARPFTYRGAASPFDAERAAGMLARLGLPAVLDRPARDLSVGQQQRVALVRALLVDPEFVLLDEPTSGLDRDAALAAEELVRERCAAGLGVLVVSHDPGQLGRWCGRVVALEAAGG